MEKKNVYLQKKIISAVACLLLFNIALSIKLNNVTPDGIGTQTTTWNEIFIYARPISIVVFVVYILSLFEKTMQVEKKIFKFINCHISEVVLCVMFIYLALYEIFYAYCDYVYISKDSSNYLREASALVRGDGFYYNRLAGYDNWFAAWPIGYPALIALFSFITRHNIYLSSKLLGIALVGIGLIILYLRFKKEAWIYSLVYLNIGFLTLYKYTWSENPFILCLIIWGLSLSKIVERDEPEKKWYFIVMLSMLGAFLSRYFGIVTIMFTGFCLFLYIAYYLFKVSA